MSVWGFIIYIVKLHLHNLHFLVVDEWCPKVLIPPIFNPPLSHSQRSSQQMPQPNQLIESWKQKHKQYLVILAQNPGMQ